MTEGDTTNVTEELERKFEEHNFKKKIRHEEESMKSRFEEAEGSFSPDTSQAIPVVAGLLAVLGLLKYRESLAATGMYQTIINVAVMFLCLWPPFRWGASGWRRRLMREVGRKTQPEDGERTYDHEKYMVSFLRSCSRKYCLLTLTEKWCYVALLVVLFSIGIYITTGPSQYIVGIILVPVILWNALVGSYDAYHMRKTDLNRYEALETEMRQVNIPHSPVINQATVDVVTSSSNNSGSSEDDKV